MNPDGQQQDDRNQNQDPTNPGPYPGFGQRHDIFYQYQAPEPDDLTPAPPPPIQEASYEPVLQEDEAAYYGEEAKSSGRKKILIIAAVFLTLLAGAGIFLLIKHGGSSQKPNTNNQAAVDPDLVNTPCFKFKLPKPHVALSSTIQTCGGTYYTGSDGTAGVTINPIDSSFNSLDDIVTAWKQNNANVTISSQNTANFNQYSAVQVYWSPSSAPSEAWMSVLVYTPPNPLDPKYLEQGAAIYGFEVDGRYDTNSTSKSVYDSILGSWVWK